MCVCLCACVLMCVNVGVDAVLESKRQSVGVRVCERDSVCECVCLIVRGWERKEREIEIRCW